MARDHLAQIGYDPAMGARPLSRVIQEKIKRPLAEELLFGKLTEGGLARVDFQDGALTFAFTAEPAPKKKVEGEQEPA